MNLQPLSGTTIIAHNVLPHEKQSIGKLLNGFIFRKSSQVIVGATTESDKLDQFSPDINRKIVPHPAYDRFFKSGLLKKRPEIRKALGIKDNLTCFMHLGLVRKYKGLDILLEAFSLMKQKARLIVSGEFYDDFNKYKELVEFYKLQERVTLQNKYLSDDELSRMLIASDAVVLPYRDATQSGVAMAALACGSPVIASNVGALSDVLSNQSFGQLVEPGDPVLLAEKLDEFVIQGRTESIAEKRNRSELVQKRYSWKSLAKQLIEDC